MSCLNMILGLLLVIPGVCRLGDKALTPLVQCHTSFLSIISNSLSDIDPQRINDIKPVLYSLVLGRVCLIIN